MVFPRPRKWCAGALLAAALARQGALAQPVEQWGRYEGVLRGPSDGNPFTDVQVSARFVHGSRTVAVAGFYDGDGVYRIRFMPEEAGEWRYETQSNRAELNGQTGRFIAVVPRPGNHGPVRVAHTYHFAYADGTPYRELGTTAYSWVHAGPERAALTLRTLAASPFNKLRMCVLPRADSAVQPTDRHFPFPGTPPRNWDVTRFNPEFFRAIEQRVGQLQDLGIEADLILFHPYDPTWGFSNQDAASDDRYLRYVVARFAAYRNVWWSLANEYDLIRTKQESDWDRMFQLVQASDPYGHLRSIHNSRLIYNQTQPWVTHVSMQNGAAVEDPDRAELYRDVYRKPVVYDEVKYEGNITQRWGQLSGEELVERFWSGVVAGTYVGHSEIFAGAGSSWLLDGGELIGQSPPRLAFLRAVMEAGPAEGLEPIDKWQDRRMGGQPGRYYLLYFGQTAPRAWPFLLYREGLKNGLRFKIDLLDTWAMTTTPVPGTFVTRQQDNYTFADAEGKAVALPGRPYLALRIQRLVNAGSAAARAGTILAPSP